MPKQSGASPYRGKRGDRIGYLRNGKHYERRAPEEVRQNENTQKASGRFGLASRMGRLIRQTLQQELDFTTKGDLANRLTQKLLSGIKNRNREDMLLELNEFKFNSYTEIRNLLPKDLRVEINSSGELYLQVPELKCKHLPKDSHVELKAIVLHINSQEVKVKRVVSDIQKFEIKTFKGADFIFRAAGGNETNLVMLQCRYYSVENGKCRITHNRKFYAADIIAVFAGNGAKPDLPQAQPS